MNEYVLIFAAALSILVFVAAGGLSAAPWLPTKRRERLLLIRKITVKPNEIVYDLGCGDGSVLFDLAKKEPAARYVGYEIAILPWLLGQIRKRGCGVRMKGISLRLRDFFGQPLGDADVIFIFLLDTSYPRVMSKLRSEKLKPDARIIVEAWRLPDIEPTETIRGKNSLPIYVYRGHQFSQT
jgi:SAM-dependent methyltransferase